MNWEDSLSRLKTGNKNYVLDKLEGKFQDSERRGGLTNGQSPYAIILSCADSRVVPELMFDTGLGEIFVIRVAGNVANTSTIASIEYAIAHLGTKLIVVMGHQSCGAVAAAVEGGDAGPNLNRLISYIQPSVNQLGTDADLADIVKDNAKNSASTIKEKSQIISDAMDQNGAKIITAYYHLDSGQVDFDN